MLLQDKDIKEVVENKGVSINSTNDNFNIVLLLADYFKNENSLFVVLPNLYTAQKYYDLFTSILDEEILFYPADELITSEIITSTGDFKLERINTIVSLLKSSNKKIIITHLNGAIKYQLPKEVWQNSVISLNINDEVNISFLVEKLIEIGYESVYTVTRSGQFSKRGSIIDIFPLNYDNPIRIDFFDDFIEHIKFFDSELQTSISHTKNVEILPITEIILSKEKIVEVLSKLENFINANKLSELEKIKYNEDYSKLVLNNNIDSFSRYISFCTDNKVTIFDFCDNKKIYFIDKDNISTLYNQIITDLENYCDSINGYSLFELNHFLPLEKLFSLENNHISRLNDVKGLYFNVFEPDNYFSDEKKIIQALKDNIKDKFILIYIKNQGRLDRFKESCLNNYIPYALIRDYKKISKGIVNIIDFEYSTCFSFPKNDLLVFNEKNIFEIKYEERKVKYKSIYSNTTKISKYEELEINDYVVHYDYGIGQYLGIKTMTHDKITRDYIHIAYRNNDSLYIPVEQVSLIQKYSKGSEFKPPLSQLGSPQWSKAKQRVRDKVREISQELISLYAKRKQALGFSFTKKSSDQVLFEADFEYELTKDQEKACNEVEEDMESLKPMDRLICGDVGYGKTEVALRAAFKAVYSGKQVIVLAPTTILSRQHFYSFSERMDKFGIKVCLVNRFVSSKDQKQIFAGLEQGVVDVVVGTHRLLNEKINYKDLGLLIIDEEQRFGVMHKEKIKRLKTNIDVLTLSATPIPRTLQMSILGIKDLSMIETPPKNRYPVQTYVLKRNDTIIKEAILRELARKGQVFYLYNYVEKIEKITMELKALVPEAKIVFAHGRMDKIDLENIICKFIDKKFDVLVCTTIIETGIDIPNCNTLIVHDSQMLGLSQMYQLRGRVGRSNKIAYAYFTYSKDIQLTNEAEQRLIAIKELNELGSGFKIAMRDLAIRGAGDILGEDQSGFIDSVGLDMYLKILDEELKQTNKVETSQKSDYIVDSSINKVYTNRYIDDNYIQNETVKIEIHKRIDLINNMMELNKLKNELEDRFGKVSEQLLDYMYEKLFKKLCDFYEIEKIEHTIYKSVILVMSESSSNKMDGNLMFKLANEVSRHLKLNYFNKKIEIVYNKKDESLSWMKIFTHYLSLLN